VALLIHIGYHKTGTSWLQQYVWRSTVLGFGRISGEGRAKEAIVAPHDLEFDPDACRSVFAGRIATAEQRGLVPVLSAERLCGDMLYGAYDSATIARRLAAVWPEAKVLAVVREQREMILSSYREYVAGGGLLRLEDYLRRPPARFPHPWPFNPVHFEYVRLVGLYRQLLPEVLVLPYELFRDDARAFVGGIVEFAGAPAASGAIDALPTDVVANPAAAGVGLRRPANLLLRGRLNPWAPFGAKSGAGKLLADAVDRAAALPPDDRERQLAIVSECIGPRYRESNRRLAELVGLDLGAFGYAV
jgi:hypothetical protein